MTMFREFVKKSNASSYCFCFHYAGGGPSVYRKFLSNNENIQVIAISLPGRETRIHDEPYTSIRDVCQELYPKMLERIQEDTRPYGIVAHSMGTHITYSIIQLLQHNKKRMPSWCCLSSFPPPNINTTKLWRTNENLNDKDFQVELSKWGVRPIVFKEPYWSQFRKILRCDFSLFDKNESNLHEETIRGIDRIVLIDASKDEVVKKDHIEMWFECFDEV